MEILLVSSSQCLQTQDALDLRSGGQQIGCVVILTAMHTHTHKLLPHAWASHTHTHMHKHPKTGHVECWCWSVSQGAPRSVHLTVRQLLMRASEWTSGEWRATRCRRFHSSSKFKTHFSLEPLLLLLYIGLPRSLGGAPSQEFPTLLLPQN